MWLTKDITFKIKIIKTFEIQTKRLMDWLHITDDHVTDIQGTSVLLQRKTSTKQWSPFVF